MSVRDTGWRSESLLDVVIWRRTIGGAVLSAAEDGRWWCDVDDVPTIAGGESDIASAKRAAEDALREFCRDTLAALGESAPPPT